MDFNKIFIKDACPTKIGGQAVMEGIMMKGGDRTALCVRMPDERMYMVTEKLKPVGFWHGVPIVRGVIVFIDSLVTGVRSLMKSAELLEAGGAWDEDDDAADGESAAENQDSVAVGGDASAVTDGGAAAENQDSVAAGGDGGPEIVIKEDRFTRWLERTFGEGATMSFVLIVSVVVAIAFTVGIFIVLPTWVMNFFGGLVENAIALNFIEGGMRIALFVLYVVAISRMKDIQTVFKFHGAEHECIHCYESDMELTPENCQRFETLHPRCGTSFLMFVMVIALLLFSMLGWPDLLPRILSRIVLIPLIAGLSYELLKWAGKSVSPVVKVLSVPGLLLQKLTTMRPDEKQLVVAIAAMKAVLVPADTPLFEGYCDKDGLPVPDEEEPGAEDGTTDGDADGGVDADADGGADTDGSADADVGEAPDNDCDADACEEPNVI
jgi:uncharacterized protein YqhQ